MRGGGGLFFDRPSGNSVFDQILNPPTLQNVTVRYGELQTLGTGGLTTTTPPSLSVYEVDAALPSSFQWNTGVQMALPWAIALDVSYVGQRGYNIVQRVNINAVDYGAAFLEKNQDPTLAPSTTPGATAVSQDLMRAIRGYSSITQNQGYLHRTFHSIQVSFQRRLQQRLLVRVQRRHRPLRPAEPGAPAAARRRRHVHRPRRSGRGGEAARQQQSTRARDEGQLHLGSPGPAAPAAA